MKLLKNYRKSLIKLLDYFGYIYDENDYHNINDFTDFYYLVDNNKIYYSNDINNIYEYNDVFLNKYDGEFYTMFEIVDDKGNLYLSIFKNDKNIETIDDYKKTILYDET